MNFDQRRWLWGVACFVGVAIVCCPLTARAAGADVWTIGVAQVNITPEQPMWMAGYASRNHVAEGKYADLWAKALVLQDADGHRGLLITLDLIGVGGALSNTICQRLADHAGWQRSQIAICASHTHTGPVVGRNLAPMHYDLVDAEQRRRIDRYSDQLVKNIVLAAERAMQRSQPGRLAWGTATAGFAVNRRNNPEPQVPQLRHDNVLRGPTDHDVPVLIARDEQNHLIAVVFGYACHCTTLSDYAWSGDYAGFAQQGLQRKYPGCAAMFWAGCGADQNPLPRRKLELAKRYGDELATAVASVVDGTTRPLSSRLQTSYRTIPLPFDHLPDREELDHQVASGNRYQQARARRLLQSIERDGRLSPTYAYPISVWRLGNCIDFVQLGGEVVVDFALRLKRELHGPQTWVAGYSHDVMAYIPSQRVWQEGGYEGATAMVYYGRPSRWAAGIEQTIVTTVHELAGTRAPDAAKSRAAVDQ